MKVKIGPLILLVSGFVFLSFTVILAPSTKEEENDVNIYRDPELVKCVYECWAAEKEENKRIGEKATRVLLPEIVCKDPNLFQFRRFYFQLYNFKEIGKGMMIWAMSEEKEIFFKPFIVEYEVFKWPRKIIRYSWCSLKKDYISYFPGDPGYEEEEKEKEKEIKDKSGQILNIAKETYGQQLKVFKERKTREQEFMQASQGLGPPLCQTSELLQRHVELSSRICNKNYYLATVALERFQRVSMVFFYDPDPDFRILQIEIEELSGQKYFFDVGYETDFNYSDNGCIWGFIDNEDATPESFEFLSDVLKSTKEKINEDPDNVKITLWQDSG